MKPARSKQLRKAGGRSGSLNQDPVEVFCRIRPLKAGSSACIKVISPETVQFALPEGMTPSRNNNKEVQHTFKYVFDQDSMQNQVFEKVGHHLVKQLITGKNGLLFTYGVTGSGKTYTMTGEPQNPGIMPRCLQLIFTYISEFQANKFVIKPDKMNGFEIHDEDEAALAARNERLGFFQAQKTPKTPRRKECEMEFVLCDDMESNENISIDDENKFSCFVTYIEIYNNSVFDLLDPVEESITRKPQNKVIREDGNKNMYVHGVTEVEVKSPEEAFEVFSRGQRRKRVAHTMLNEESSRSHSVFTIRLVQVPLENADDDMLRKLMTISQLSLVDLAGSERTNRTKNTGQRLREAGSINNSLMTLRTCLETLRENQQTGGTKMVPYRDSKLTHLFKNYFDGEGSVRMIVCVNPGVEDYDETSQVLKFAELTQEVQVIRPTPQRVDVAMTPAKRRRAMLHRRSDEEVVMPTPTPTPTPLQFSQVHVSWPSLVVMGPDDSETLNNLEMFLINRDSSRSASITDLLIAQEEVRRALMKLDYDLDSTKENNVALQMLLKQEKKKNESNEGRFGAQSAEHFELQQKLAERDIVIQTLKARLEEKDLIINQQGLAKEKYKEKCQQKLQMQDKRMRRELQLKIDQGREDIEEEMRLKDEKIRHIKKVLADTPSVTVRSRRCAEYPLTPRTVNPSGTLYQAPASATVHTPSSARPAVSNPRHRRSRSAGNSDRWLDHRPAQPVELSTVFQPTLRKRKSVTKLVDKKDVVNSKTSKYCLTTQEQDTDGELETKLYKGDVVPTCTGGAQVILHDVETLKQSSPTAGPARKRSVPDENTEGRCKISVEGHGKRFRC